MTRKDKVKLFSGFVFGMLVFIFICMWFPGKKRNPCNPFSMSSTPLVQHSATARIILQSKKSKSLFVFFIYIYIYNATSRTKRVQEKCRIKRRIHGKKMEAVARDEALHRRPHRAGWWALLAGAALNNKQEMPWNPPSRFVCRERLKFARWD